MAKKAFKGFNKDLTCRGFQYEEGKEFETARAECCEEGFHACEYPLDCLGYYSPNSSVYHEVELDGDYGASSATGNCGASSATGYRGASSVSDPTGVAVAWGHEARAKGCLGAHLILSDWRYIGEKYSDGDYKYPYRVESWELAGAKLVIVDGEKIKADTYYRCINGEIVEVDEDGEIAE